MSEWDKLLADRRVLNDGVPVYLRQQPVGVPDGWVRALVETWRIRAEKNYARHERTKLHSEIDWESKGRAEALSDCADELEGALEPQPPAQPSADAEVSNEMVLRAVHVSLDWPHPLTHFEARKALEAAMARESDAARAAEGGE